MKYKIFIDDSGSKDFINPFTSIEIDTPSPFNKTTFEFWNNNYFVLCGVKIKEADIIEVDNAFKELKMKFFNTTSVEIKSVWLRNPVKKKKHYLDKFGLDENALDQFGVEYHDVIWKLHSKVNLIGVVIDKRYYKNRSEPKNDPLKRATQVLFERITFQSLDSDINNVVFDQMENNLNIKAGRHGQILKISQNVGVQEIFIQEYSINDLSFESSAKSNFLQIADICSYDINRQFMLYGRDWIGVSSKSNRKLPLYQYFKKIMCNFCRSNKSQVRGCGLCVIPDKSKINWDFGAICAHKKTPHL